jgi:hypothetical protein
MLTLLKILVMLVRLSFLGLIVLGIGFWTGHWSALIPTHMLLGLLLVLCLWVTALIAASVGVPVGPVAAGIVWGAAVVALGMTQMSVLPGPSHWVIQIVHLLLGIGAIGLNETLSRRAASAISARTK